MQQRYYDPVAGRFSSVDPVVTDASTGGSFNRYAYVNNNPYKYIDPDGRLAFLIPLVPYIVGGGTVAVVAHYVLPGRQGREDTARAVGNAILNGSSGEKGNTNQASTDGGNNDTNNDGKVTVAPGTSNPMEGEPGSCSTCNNSRGNRKQDRYYGPDGWPEKDVDYDHDHKDDSGKKGGEPHVHDWGRPPGGGRPNADNRGGARPPRPEEVHNERISERF